MRIGTDPRSRGWEGLQERGVRHHEAEHDAEAQVRLVDQARSRYDYSAQRLNTATSLGSLSKDSDSVMFDSFKQASRRVKITPDFR